jgi:superfamily II DNA or RNA helicase
MNHNSVALNPVGLTEADRNVIRDIYQQKIVDDIRDCIKGGKKRVLVQAHPASGKSHVFEKIAFAAINKNKTIFYVAPRINLVLDIHKKVARNGMHCGFMMSGCERDFFAKTQLCCTPSLLNRIKSTQGVPHADILVIDEAHVEQESVAELVSYYHDAVIITMTGTPLPGMDVFVDAAVKGPTMAFLTSNGLLTPVTYIKARPEDVPASLSGKRANKLIGEPVSTWIEH